MTIDARTSPAVLQPADVRPREAAARPWHGGWASDGGPADTPAVATGRALLAVVWQRLLDGAIECIDVHFRSGHVVTDLIALRVYGPIAEATQVRGSWTHVFALDDIALIRGVGFGRLR